MSEPREAGDLKAVMGRLLGYMIGGPARWSFIFAVFVRSLSLVALILIPLFIGEAINALNDPDGSESDVWQWVIWAAISGAAVIGLSFFAERQFARLATNALYRLQTDMEKKTMRLSLDFFHRQPLGQLMSRVTNDMETVALFYENAVGQIARAFVQVTLLIIVMFALDWRLTLAALLIVPIMLGLTLVVQRIASPAFTLLQNELGGLSGFQEETITGHKVIISNRRQDWAGDRNEEQANQVFLASSKAFFVSVLQFPLIQMLVVLQTALVLMIGGFLVLAGETTLGLLVSFVGYVGLLSAPLSEVSNLTSTVLRALAGGRRVFEIMDEEPTITDAPDATDFEFKGGHVEFEKVDFSYIPHRKILRHNTFEAKPGELIGICGPTGAGKSTIINILTRYYDIDSGAILIDGQEIQNLTRLSLRGQIGVVAQEPFLFTDTVMNNLLYAREGATAEDCIEAAKQANAHDFILALPEGYDTLLTERGANLSQGQRQMVTIARAMVAQPKLLILDEATSNVDTRTEKRIQEGLTRLMSGRTSFVIAHRLATIRDADKIMVLDEGEIVEFGPHDELMAARGFYHSLYMSQFKSKASGNGAAADFS